MGPPQHDRNREHDGYFQSYGDVRVHALMLRDWPRVAAYATALESLKPCIVGKRVMDVGAGSGVLSLFAAAAGAQEVIAVEANPHMAALLEEHVRHNEASGTLQPGLVHVVNCAVEDLPKHPSFNPDWVRGVDIIVSEWMGFYLLHEGMLPSFLFARDMFLRPDTGLLLPCSARIVVSLASNPTLYTEQVGFLSEYCGFSFEPLKQQLHLQHNMTPLVTQLTPEDCTLCQAQVVEELDLYKITDTDLRTIDRKVELKIQRADAVHAFVFWFDVTFPGKPAGKASKAEYGDNEHRPAAAASVPPPVPSTESSRRFAAAEAAAIDAASHSKPDSQRVRIEHAAAAARAAAEQAAPADGATVTLDTSPFSRPTHWKQLLMLLPTPLEAPAGLELTLRAVLQQAEADSRCYRISVEVEDAQLPEAQQPREQR